MFTELWLALRISLASLSSPLFLSQHTLRLTIYSSRLPFTVIAAHATFTTFAVFIVAVFTTSATFHPNSLSSHQVHRSLLLLPSLPLLLSLPWPFLLPWPLTTFTALTVFALTRHKIVRISILRSELY